MTDLTALEEQIAHLTRAQEDLHEIVLDQARELSRLRARLAALTEGLAALTPETGVSFGTERPPHY